MLSLGQAARAANTSKTTIGRAIKSGRLSATRRDDGGYAIDPSELARVFCVTPDDGHVPVTVERGETPDATPVTDDLALEGADDRTSGRSRRLAGSSGAPGPARALAGARRPTCPPPLVETVGGLKGRLTTRTDAKYCSSACCQKSYRQPTMGMSSGWASSWTSAGS